MATRTCGRMRSQRQSWLRRPLRPPPCWSRSTSRPVLARHVAGQPFEAAQMIAVVAKRDLEIAIHRHVPVLLVDSRQHSPVVGVKGLHVADQHQPRRGPLVQRVVEVDPAEIGSVVGEEIECWILSGGDGTNSRHVAIEFRGREMRGDVAEVPGANPRRRVFGGWPEQGEKSHTSDAAWRPWYRTMAEAREGSAAHTTNPAGRLSSSPSPTS